jgi:hypothetical protein
LKTDADNSMQMDKDITKAFTSVIDLLNQNKIPYMIVGSVASMIYGEPRLTHDMDIVVQVFPEDAKHLLNIFNTDAFTCPPLQTIQEKIQRKGQFNIIHFESMYKIDLILSRNSLHDIEEFKRRKKMPFWEDTEAFIATPEDIIIKKLEFYRKGKSEKHLRDIASILLHTTVDQEYLDKWIKTLSLQTEWGKVIASS